ncbi:MAG TPA: PIG-L family deacetylase [Edaphobacter sp.]|nr:PIG-L family deacetylase [Edaphobacter sp.]
MGQRLMCVVAHPDDECYGFGGTLALAADRDVETYVVCMTDGQAATNRGAAGTAAELGAMRRAEFAASCKVLGVTQQELLDYQDGQLENVPTIAAVERLVERMRRFRPNVVITFGGDGGMNSHSDHMMVSFWTTAAFHWAGQPKRFPGLGAPHQADRLFHLTTNFFLPDRQPPRPIPWTVRLDIREASARKLEAFRQHHSQAPLMELTKTVFDKLGSEEFYTLMASSDPQPAQQGTDLFEGLATPSPGFAAKS